MRITPVLKNINLTNAGLVLFVILLTLAAGLSGLIFESPHSPIIVAVAVVGIVLAVIFLQDSGLALCAAIFIALLPQQILSLVPIPVIRQYPVLVCVGLACFSWLLGMMRHHQKIVWTSTTLLMIAFLVWSIATLFWAANPALGRQCLISYIIGLVLLLLSVNTIDSPKNVNRLMITLALHGWMLMLASTITILTRGYIPSTRLKVLDMNENDMGILALLAMIGVLWQVMQPSTHHRKIKELLSWIFLLMTIGLVAVSGSRGSAVSLLITLLTFCLWKPTRLWGVRGLLVLGLAVLFVPMAFTTTLERFAAMEGDTFFGPREVLWQAAWNLIVDHPWQGVGIGNGRYELIRYLSQITGIAGAARAATHNPVLQVWGETGLPGIILYMGVPVSAVWLFVREYLRCRERDMQGLLPYFALLSSSFAGYMASWIKGGGMEVSITYFLMLSLLLIPVCLDSKSQMVSAEPPAMNLGDTLHYAK
jgi:O-antigen ligase